MGSGCTGAVLARKSDISTAKGDVTDGVKPGGKGGGGGGVGSTDKEEAGEGACTV